MYTLNSLGIAVLRAAIVLLFWVLLGIWSGLSAQTYAFQHITEKEGLPSRYLYDLKQDLYGHIWISSEAGLVWFDGKNYRNSEIQYHIPHEIIRMYRDNSGEIWLHDLSGRISLYKHGTIRTFPQIQPSSIFLYAVFFADQSGDVWIADQEHVFVYQHEIDSLVQLDLVEKGECLDFLKAFSQDADGNITLLTRSGYYTFASNKIDFLPYKNPSFIRNFQHPFRIDGTTYAFVNGKAQYFDGSAWVISPDFLPFNVALNGKVIDTYQDRSGRVWMATYNGLYLFEPQNQGGYKMSRHLEGEVMGGILEDFEGNLWFSTSQNGVYKLPSLQIEVFQKMGLDQPIRFIRENERNEMVIGFDDNRIMVMDTSMRLVHEEKLDKQNTRLYDYEVNRQNGDQYFITSKGFTYFDQDFKQKKDVIIGAFKTAENTNDGRLWVGTGSVFGYIKDNDNIKVLLKKRTYAVRAVDAEELWVGTIDGPYHYQDGTITRIENEQLQLDIRDIELLEEDRVLFATQKNGLFLYQPSTDSVLHHYTTLNGLSSNFCTTIYLEGSDIWLGTKKGVCKIDWRNNTIRAIGTDQGLPSEEVNAIYKKSDRFCVGTNKGLAIFSDSIQLERPPPILEINSIKISERDTQFFQVYDLDHTQNNIKIEFGAITFKNADQVIYAYRMGPIDKDWIYTRVNGVQYPALRPGKYTFEVKTKTTNSDWSEAKVMNFRIKPPFWSTWWFYTLSWLLLIGTTLFIFREINRQNRILRELKSSELTALRAQMSPHFVFNALNSIQEFIINRDPKAANRYLTQFARLIRNILNVSEKDRISLQKEIESLKLYLSLESLRIGEDFEFVFEVEESMDPDDYFIPSMLIQPFIENAVKHGLMHKKGPKKLYIRFYRKEEKLICEVEDNGIGRKKSAEIRAQNPRIYPSKATGLTSKRIKLFNALKKDSIHARILDMYSEQDESLGTKVVIEIDSEFKGID